MKCTQNRLICCIFDFILRAIRYFVTYTFVLIYNIVCMPIKYCFYSYCSYCHIMLMSESLSIKKCGDVMSKFIKTHFNEKQRKFIFHSHSCCCCEERKYLFKSEVWMSEIESTSCIQRTSVHDYSSTKNANKL